MPKIQWADLPPALRDHLFERLRDRKISVEDLYQLKLWRESGPDAPDTLGIRTSGPLRSVVKGNIQRLSFSGASPQGVRSCDASVVVD